MDSYTHKMNIKNLQYKQKVATMKQKEMKMKWKIFKTYFPFRITLKFNKVIVLICIAAIILYTLAAILLQKNTGMEISPTLTTCVYAFFGTELIGMAGIKMNETKYTVIESQQSNVNDSDAVG